MTRRSRRAVARAAGAERAAGALLGLVLLAAGTLAVVVGTGALGAYRARRPLADPLVVAWVDGHLTLARLIALGVGIVLLAAGLAGALRSLRPETRPDIILSARAGQRLTVTHAALCDAVRGDAETVPGVSRARVRLVGDAHRPALRMVLRLDEGTDLGEVWSALDDRVLTRAREAFSVAALPVAIRLELDAASATGAPRVR